MRNKGYWTLESCKADALKYNSRGSWKNSGSSGYVVARINKWLDKCCGHMISTRRSHTLKSCKESALKYKTRSEWEKNDRFAYNAAIQNKWLEECCFGMEYVYDKHSLESCKKDALKYRTKSEWDKNSPSVYRSALYHGWHKECCEHMKCNYENHTIESCKEDALKYKTRSEWNKESNKYQASVKRGWHEECCEHMPSISGKSLPEKQLSNFIDSLNEKIILHSRKTIPPLELDVFIPDKNIAIEFNGLYWHSDQQKNKNYHFNKRQMCKENRIQLIQINEDEWRDKQEIVKSIIKAKLGLCKHKYYARKFEIKKVCTELSQLFLQKNHLMGEFKSAKHIGLFYEDELVSLISYKKYKEGIDISRFCNKLDTSVAGGLSKLLKYIEKTENPKFIQSFVDLRYGNGDSLLGLGFKLESISLGWKWTNKTNTFNRLHCRANMDDRKLTEKQHAEEFGLSKIYDAGQAKFVRMLMPIGL